MKIRSLLHLLKVGLLIYLINIIPTSVNAQIEKVLETIPFDCSEFDPNKVKLKEVVYGGSGQITIRKDDDTDDYGDVAWASDLSSSPTITKTPIAYVSNKKAEIGAKFQIEDYEGSLWIKGDGPGEFDPEVQQLNISNGEGVYPLKKMPEKFPNNTVAYYENFEITWYVATTNSSDSDDWIELNDKSSHLMYVTRKSPSLVGTIGQYPYCQYDKIFHSILHLSCKNANGESNINSIVEKNFDDFKLDKKIYLIDEINPLTYKSNPITYWGSVNSPCVGLVGLLQGNDGTCGSLACFFNAILKIQGIENSYMYTIVWNVADNYLFPFVPEGSNILTDAQNSVNTFFGTQAGDVERPEEQVCIDITDPNGNPTGEQECETGVQALILVKNWGNGDSNSFHLRGTPSNISTIELDNENTITLGNSLGIEGQGGEPQNSVFYNHAVVKHNGNIYDSSYGTFASSENDWETSSLDGFGIRLIFNYETGTPTPTPMEIELVWVYQTNTSNQQTSFN